MCGRYAYTPTVEAMRQIRALLGSENAPVPPRFNIAPTQPIAIIRLFEEQRQWALVRWGLIPSWVKDPRAFSLIVNARGESVLDKPSYKSAMRYRRCLIPADGFYEWKRGVRGKQPYFVRRRDRAPIAIAGLWESWMGPNGEELETAAIVTTQANATLMPIHDRMPVIVPEAAFDLWLNTHAVDAETANALIVPAPDDLLEAYPVSHTVNRAANDAPGLIEPVREGAAEAAAEPAPKRKRAAGDTRQGSLF